jgi:glycosyltransferase involved in cell wall biosynthesis
VQKQTHKDWELLFIDDGSTDNTKEIVASIQEKDPRIKYIYQENSGASARPKNVGLREAMGEYIAFLDHDDEWMPEKLEKHLARFAELQDGNVGLIATNAMIVNLEDGSKLEHKMPKTGEPTTSLLERNYIFCSSGVMVKREVLSKVGFFDDNFKLGDDWDMWLRISLVSDFDYVYEPLYYFYRHNGTVTSNLKSKVKIQDYEYGLSKHLSLYKKYRKEFGYRLLTMGRICYIAGERKKGIIFFLKTIIVNPFEIRAYVNLLFAILGPFSYNLFLGTRNKFKANQ